MTVPDSAPTAEDVLASTVSQHRLVSVSGGTASASTWACICGDSGRYPGDTRDWAAAQHSRHVAAAVVAAIRRMSPAQLVELRPDLTVKRSMRMEWTDTEEPISSPADLVRPDSEPPPTRQALRLVPCVRVVGPWIDVEP